MSNKSHILETEGMRSLSNLHIQKRRAYFGHAPRSSTEHLRHHVLVADPCYSQRLSSHSQAMNLKTLEQSPKLRKKEKSRERVGST